MVACCWPFLNTHNEGGDLETEKVHSESELGVSALPVLVLVTCKGIWDESVILVSGRPL